MSDITTAAVEHDDFAGTFAADDSDPVSLLSFAARHGVYRRVVGVTIGNSSQDEIPVASMDVPDDTASEGFRRPISRTVEASGGELRVETYTTLIPRRDVGESFHQMMTRAFVSGIDFETVVEVGLHELDQGCPPTGAESA